MAFFVNQEFNSFEELLQVKKAYACANNVVLVRRDTHLLKGEGELVRKLIYSRLSLQCKAGRERPSESKGMRKSSTFKKNCPMRINIVFKGDKLKVTSMNEVHENHQLNQQTFLHYPENVRLSKEEINLVSTSLEADGKKFKIKNQLMEERKKHGNEAPILLKSIHNLQTAKRIDMEKVIPGESELEKLLSSMLKVPGANVRVLRDENDELVCIFFQDTRMASIFDKYPELVLYDATYKMNEREMPLFVQSVVDGNGTTEIVTLAICKSESLAVIEFVLDSFKEINPNWTKIKCVIGDKDFADRIVYKEKFIGVALQICLFHVLRTFNREISAKRGITKDERQKALEILQRLCYASSYDYYDEQYEKLCQLNIESVTEYYNTNWHSIKDEWTLCGRNQYANYLNSTNNRSESMNHKIKTVGTRNSNLLTFFENVSTSVSVLASEKDIKVLRQDMRVERIRFQDANLLNYHQFLTPFVCSKIQMEFGQMEFVNFTSCDTDSGITISGLTVTSSKCSCQFHLSMILPCRHILRFRKEIGMELFAPELCAPRWTAQYYNTSHPALQMNVHIPVTVPIYVQKVRIPEEKDRYRAAASITKEINTLVSTMATGQYTFFLEKLKNFKNQIHTPITDHYIGIDEENGASPSFRGVVNSTSNGQIDQSNVALDALDLSVPRNCNTGEMILPILKSNGVATTRSADGSATIPANGPSHMEIDCPSQVAVNAISDSRFDANESRLIIVGPTSKDIQKIKLPHKHASIGRPKGSSTTSVIGTKLKKLKTNSGDSSPNRPTNLPKRSDRIRNSREKISEMHRAESKNKTSKKQ